MKIGIIGLLSEQASIIRNAFPEHSIETLPRERERDASTFAARCDKVILVTKFISHKVQGAVPRGKRILVNGGVSDVRRVIHMMPSPVKVEGTIPVSREKAQKKPAVTTNAPKNDFKSLLTMAIGASLSIKRRPDQTIAQFEANIENVRSYYRRKHNVETLVQYSNGSLAEIEVVRRGPKPTKAKAVPVTTVSDVEKLAWVSFYTAHGIRFPESSIEEQISAADHLLETVFQNRFRTN